MSHPRHLRPGVVLDDPGTWVYLPGADPSDPPPRVLLSGRVYPHGHTRYKVNKCRCYVCGLAESERSATRRQRIKEGTWTVPAAPVVRHVRSLMASGMGWKRISELAGISTGPIATLLWGRQGCPPAKTVHYDMAQKILAVTFNPRADAFVDGTATRRRVQALCWMGYPLTWQAEQIGWSPWNLGRLARGEHKHVKARSALAVFHLFEKYQATVPRGEWVGRARRNARKHGWAPPAAWDDDTIGNPDAHPKGLRDDHAQVA